MSNPILDDRNIEFLLYEVLSVEELCAYPYFADHSRETFDPFLASCRRFAREQLFGCYVEMDEAGAELKDGKVATHPLMRSLWPRFCDLGVLAAMRPYDVGGQQLPFSVLSSALAYLYGANLGASGFAGLTLSAAHLIEDYGSDEVRGLFMKRMYAGEWTGTMALTEPQAGSSLGDLTTTAVPDDDGRYRLRGQKIFISGGDQDFTENIVHLTLARIEGAPAGVKGISLFAVPKKRPGAAGLEDNDVKTSGVIHKLGWRGLPSVILSYGESDDCKGWLVGEPHQGLRYMFQMMNEARVGVGISAAATASAAYLESVSYAKERTQGRRLSQGAGDTKPVRIFEHADVRRMLLRQKAIVEGSLALALLTARYADVAEHATDAEERDRARALLDLLTPITKTFPAERGFESNALAVQVHGGYGYSTEYLPQAWLRDQKLNTLHEGTTGIQSLDLLGRKVMRGGGAALMLLADEVQRDVSAAREAGLPEAWTDAMSAALARIGEVTMKLGERASDLDLMLQDSADYLDMMSVAVVGWLWLKQATVAARAASSGEGKDRDFYEGKRRAAQLWFAQEMPRVALLAERIEAGDDAFQTLREEEL